MDIRYSPDHTYTKEHCDRITEQLNFGELQDESNRDRFTFVPMCAGSDCFKVAIYDGENHFIAYW